jgi:Spy/CpxP family protein refolding chaperone
MENMNWLKYAAYAALVTSLATPALAQDREQRRPGPGHLNVETALRMREELKLTDSQAAQLEALRKEIVAYRQEQAREMIELRSRAEAGLIEREAIRKEMQSRREAVRNTLEQRRERIERLLTEEQREQLGRMHMRHGRMGGMRPQQGRRGFVPGRYYWF